MSNNWSDSTTFDEVCRRASGRRHYNSVRQFRALMRRREVLELMANLGDPLAWGSRARIARQLGVSRSTICRDFQYILVRMREGKTCPLCGRLRL